MGDVVFSKEALMLVMRSDCPKSVLKEVLENVSEDGGDWFVMTRKESRRDNDEWAYKGVRPRWFGKSGVSGFAVRVDSRSIDKEFVYVSSPRP